MKPTVIITLTLVLILSKFNHVIGQQNILYIDSLKNYINSTDSLITSFSDHPQIELIHSWSHYNCKNVFRGAFLEYYSDTTGRISRLQYRSICDTPMVEKTYYIINNKMIFASIEYPEKEKRRMTKYFMNDRLIMLNDHWVKGGNQKLDKDLKEGYLRLKRMKPK